MVADNKLKIKYLIGSSTPVVVNYQLSSIMHALNLTHVQQEEEMASSVILE